MPLFAAHAILTPEGLRDGLVLETDEAGVVVALRPPHPDEKPEMLDGVLIPGLVNAHCHLELSALKGMISPGTGMAGFIRQVVGIRKEISQQEREAVVLREMDRLYAAGTQLVGDISNDATSLTAKTGHSLATHTFVEVLGLVPERAGPALATAREVEAAFHGAGLAASLTLHAPYSVSEELVKQFWQMPPAAVSIHLMESVEEMQYFTNLTGPLAEAFLAMGLPLPPVAGLRPDEWVWAHASQHQRGLAVHLTEAQPTDLERLTSRFPNLYFGLCPRSNGYIHGTMPDIERLWPWRDRICLGTDSLASNADLNVWQEALALQDAFPWLPPEDLLQALTLNGARALGLAHRYGAFVEGATPGVVLLEHWKPDMRLGGEVRRVG